MENKVTPVNNNYPQEAIRRRAQQRHYIAQGIKKLLDIPLVGIIVLLLVAVVFISTWKTADRLIPHVTRAPILIPAVTYAVRVFIPTILLLILSGLLWLIGIPRKFKEIERDIAIAFDIAQKKPLHYRWPFLVSSNPVKDSDATEYIFWSRWIPIDQWNKSETKSAILWALKSHSDDDFTNGKKKYTVVIRVLSGVEQKEKGTPKDPLFE